MINETDFYFKHPFCMTVAGPSQCGKTRFIMELLEKRSTFIYPNPSRIIYCYSVWQENFALMKENLESVEFHEGLPSIENMNAEENNLIILDDLMSECLDDKKILHLFTVGSHHRNISVIFLTQNIFCKGKHARSISLNSHYLILFRNIRDPSQIMHLGRQLYPGNVKYFEEAFDDAVMSQNYGYLIVDLKQNTPETLRLRTIDRETLTHFVYIKKK
jgi:hypothetical protein